ncbi:hypothetical protein [Aquimarina sp. 2201CG14-23]|uniref:hypothetical protein n=1 Tax=Aquimarina mycalae TaxID=3040073 RepID=UPI002478074E|nr:hypothetical protein [Aquimarina sp. 2201CG14-23]MDH7446232.1 hypothetical protein [Aquimarina sp. 2201CG14-23]
MKSNKHIIASVFLILFSFMQLADLHAVDHDANDMDCKICQLASENLDDDFVSVDFTEIPKVVIIPVDRIQINNVDTYSNSESHYSFLNKAPPVV